MNRSLLYVCLSVATVLITSSCVNKDYSLLGDIDYTLSSEMTLVGPIGHSNIKLFEALPDSFRSFKFEYDENDVFFTKQDTEHLGNDIIGSMKMVPHCEKWEKNVKVTPNPENPKQGTCDSIFTFIFDGINDKPEEERLDSIMYKDGQKLVVRFDTDVELTKCSIQIVFDNDVISLNPAVYPDNKIEYVVKQKETDLEVDLSRAVFKFNGGTKLKMEYHAQVTASKDIEDYKSITVGLININDLKPRITYGYLGPDKHLADKTKTIDFAYTQDLQKGDDFFLPFYDPQINIRGINSIGIPAKYELYYVKVYNTATGEEQYAEFNGSPGTSFTLNYPKYEDAIKGKNRAKINATQMADIQQETSFLCDRSYGHTDRLFKIRANKLSYSYEIRTPETIGSDVSFFFDNSNIDMVMDVKLPCRFEGNTSDWMKNFYIDRYDTVKIDFSGIKPDEKLQLTDETVARAKIDFINHLPVDADAEYWLIGKDKQIILPQKKGSVAIKAAPTDETGVVTAPTAETNAYIKFNYAEYKEMTDKGAGLVIKYKVINKELKDIWFKSNDWIDVTIEAWAHGTVAYDFNKEKGGEQ